MSNLGRLCSPIRLLSVGLLAGLPFLVLPGEGQARSRGIATVGCDGCHGSAHNSSLTLSPTSVSPGQPVTLNFKVSDPDAKVAGVFIEVPDVAQFSAPSGSQLAVVLGGLSHTSPRTVSGGSATFPVKWNVPAGSGAVRFFVSSVGANNNGQSSGDEANLEIFDVVYGCTGRMFYRDDDKDGFGRSSDERLGCTGSPPEGYASEAGDCADDDPARYPGASEYCNRKDDDCDDEIDEDALPVALYPDADGDGFYSSSEKIEADLVMGCAPYAGYADRPGDCAKDNAEVNPDVAEVCNLTWDDDCDGRVDERVKPTCGEGWCRRESLTCDVDACTPGDPVEEKCNFFDDDCDGEVDEGALCDEGEECLAGECRPAEIDVTPGGPAVAADDGTSAGGAGSQSSEGDAAQASGCSVSPGLPGPSAPWAPLGLLGLGLGVWVRRARARDAQT